MKVRIRLDTLSEVTEFANITSTILERVIVTDNNGLSVNAKSTLGMLYAMEFSELWCQCDKDIYNKIEKFII